MTDQPANSSENAQDFIDAIVERDEKDASKAGKKYKARRSRAPLLIALSVLFVASSAANVALIAKQNQSAFTEEDESAQALVTMAAAADAIETYARKTGKLPESLGVVNIEVDGLHYNLIGESYRLEITTPAGRFEYNRGDQPDLLTTELTSIMESK